VKRILALLMVSLFLVAAMAVTASTAFADPPGPSSDQCKGQKKNPHCPSGKFFP
jgi:hypothetical protein